MLVECGKFTLQAIALFRVLSVLREGRLKLLFQTVALDGSRYILIQGRVASGQADALLTEFRQIASTFRVSN